MTTPATAPGTVAITLPRGALRAFRLYMINLVQTLSWPWGILALSFAVNLALGIVGVYENADSAYTGGLASLYIVIMVAYLQAMAQIFPFALGMGISRRSFFLGTVAFAAAEAVLYGLLVYLLSLVEKASDGWGVNLWFFGVPWLTKGAGPLELLVTYVVPLFAMASLALFVGAVHKRWGATGLLSLSALAVVVLGGLAVLITWQDGWGAFGGWFADQSPLALTAGWPCLPAAAALAGAWFLIRRSTP